MIYSVWCVVYECGIHVYMYVCMHVWCIVCGGICVCGVCWMFLWDVYMVWCMCVYEVYLECVLWYGVWCMCVVYLACVCLCVVCVF
jgi:hypothetical protein